MTTNEFVEQLKKGMVRFENSTLKPPAGLAGPFLGPLAESQSVHYGVEVSRLALADGIWAGVHEWWLIVDTYFVRVTAQITEPGRLVLTANHRIYQLATLSEIDLRTQYEASGGGSTVYLRSAALGFLPSPKDQPLLVNAEHGSYELEPEALVMFAQHLLARSSVSGT